MSEIKQEAINEEAYWPASEGKLFFFQDEGALHPFGLGVAGSVC